MKTTIGRNDLFDHACFDNVDVRDDRTVWVQKCDRNLNPEGDFEQVGVLDESISVEDGRLEVLESYSK